MDQKQFEKEKLALVQTILGQSDWDTSAVTDPLSSIVGQDLPYSIKFKVVDIPGILRDNIEEKDDFSKVISALKILKKYARNLQKPEELRPPMWHTIMFSNGIFKTNVDVIKGAREVLRKVGYKEETELGLCFAKNVKPDQLTIAIVITELMLGLGEIEQYSSGKANFPVHLDSLIPPIARVQQQQFHFTAVSRSPDTAREVDLRGAERSSLRNEASPKFVRVIGKTEPCDICGNEVTIVVCEPCNSKWLCEECDQRYHGHPDRRSHVRSRVIIDVGSPSWKEPVESEETTQSFAEDVPSLPWGSGVSYASDMSGALRSTTNDVPKHLSGIDTSVHSISSGQLPALSGVFSASNSADLLASTASLSGVAASRGVNGTGNRAMAGNVPYPGEFKMNPASIQAHNSFLNRITGHPDKVNDFKRLLITEYRGPTCNLLAQIMTVQPLNKQREILDMCVSKLQMGLLRGDAHSEVNDQLVRQQLMCLQRYRERWDLLVRQNTEELNQTPVSGQSNSSESGGSAGNVTFVININSHLNQTQNQEINVSNNRATFVSNPNGAGNQTSFGGAPLQIEQSENLSFCPPNPLALLGSDVNNSVKSAKLSYAHEQEAAPNHTCHICQRATRTNTQFCQHCGNRIEQYASEMQVMDMERTTSNAETKSPLLWQCGHCTYRNHPDSLACEMCQRVTDDPLWISDESEEVAQDPFIQQLHKVDQEDLNDEELIEHSKRMLHFQKNPLLENLRPVEDETYQRSQAKDVTSIQRKRVGESAMTPLIMNVNQTQRRSMMQETSTGFIYNLVGGDMSRMSPGGCGSPIPAAESLPSILSSAKEGEKHLEHQAKLLVSKIRDAEINNFSLEEFEMAIDHCTADADPIHWLSLTWDQTVEEAKAVLEALTSELDRTKFFFSDQQIRGKLVSCDGDVDKATSELIKERVQTLQQLKELETFTEEEIIQALHDCHRNEESAESHLVNKFLSEFRSAIWEADPGINEELERVIRDKETDSQRRGRLVLVEGFLKSWGRVETVLYLLDHAQVDPSISLDDIIDAANECGHKAATLQYLHQECQICFSTYSRNKIMNLTHCQCQVCRPCMQEYFEVVIRERPVRDFVCPVCLQPDIQDAEQSQQHFQFLDLQLKGLVQNDTVELYHRKVRDWILMQDPHFRWCSHCDSGFLFTPEEGVDDLQMTCPQCAKQTCYKCKRPWEDQHAGLTCDQFTDWKIANDPEHQAQGLARHLQENGIECPSCKFRYVLSRGGCMHFKCTQCQHEFCSGCYKPFKRQNCQFLRSCAHAGLHCHHPRDCLFYLRDYENEELQTLLKESKIVYNEDQTDDTDDSHKDPTCPIVEQKETASGLVDEACGKDVTPKHAGLCLLHYKEYLVDLVNKHNLDPVSIMTTEQLELQLKKYEKPTLKRKGKESEASYRKRLIGHVQNQIPIIVKSRKNYRR